jgi:hypothetical protein
MNHSLLDVCEMCAAKRNDQPPAITETDQQPTPVSSDNNSNMARKVSVESQLVEESQHPNIEVFHLSSPIGQILRLQRVEADLAKSQELVVASLEQEWRADPAEDAEEETGFRFENPSSAANSYHTSRSSSPGFRPNQVESAAASMWAFGRDNTKTPEEIDDQTSITADDDVAQQQPSNFETSVEGTSTPVSFILIAIS